MRSTRHFAGVVGAAGIVVSPFMAPFAAQADDTLPTDTLDYAVEGDADPGIDTVATDDVPDLPVTRAVGKAASLDLMMIDNKAVALDLPDEVNLPIDGAKLSTRDAVALQGTLSQYVVEGDLNITPGSDVVFYDSDSLDAVEWVVDEEGNVVAQPRVESNANAGAGVAANTGATNGGAVRVGNGLVASGTVGVATPATTESNATDTAEGTKDGVASAPREVAPREAAPQLPITGDDTARMATGEGSTLPMAPLLGITGLVVAGGIGAVTLRKRMEFEDSANM